MEISEATLAVLTTIIAGTISFVTVTITLIFKPIADKWLHLYKVKTEHKYHQIKKVKETLASRKVPLINSADSLVKRLNSLIRRRSEKLHHVKGDYTNFKNEYFHTTVFRMLRFFALIKIIEDELIFLDTTITTKEDLFLIKYFKTIWDTLHSGPLLLGLTDNHSSGPDVIRRDKIDEMCEWMIKNGRVLSYKEYKSNAKKNIKSFKFLCEFLD